MKTKIRIMNIFYLLFSAVAIFFLTCTPFFTANVSVDITYDLVSDSIDTSVFDEFGVTAEDLFADDDEVQFDMRFKLDVNTMVASFTASDIDTFVKKTLLEPVVAEVVPEIEDTLLRMARNGVSAMIRRAFMDELDSLIPLNENLFNKLDAKGYTEENVDTSINDMVDMIFDESGDQTLTTIAEKFAEEYNKYAVALDEDEKNAESFSKKLRPYFLKFELINRRTETIQPIDDVIGSILQTFIDGGNVSDDDFYDDDEMPYGFAYKFCAPMLKSNGYDSPLTAKIIEVIYNNYSELNGLSTPAILLFLVWTSAVLLILFIFAWALKALKCVIRFFTKKPYIRISPIFIITGVLEVILSIIAIVSAMLVTLDMEVLKTLPIIGGIASTLPLGLTMQLSFSALIPGILVIVNLLFSIVYGAVKKKYKKDVKREKEAYIDIE